MCCSKAETDYYVKFHEVDGLEINNDTIYVELNTTFFSKIEVQTTSENRQAFISIWLRRVDRFDSEYIS